MFKTVTARASIVVFGVVFISSIFYFFQTTKFSSPLEWYGYSQGDEAEIDIRSPNGRAIAAITFLPQPSFAQFTYDQYRVRCRSLERDLALIVEQKKLYRGVVFCNGAALPGQKFTQSFNFFKTLVDDLYITYYKEYVEIFIKSLFLALSGVFIFVLIAIIKRWVFRGA